MQSFCTDQGGGQPPVDGNDEGFGNPNCRTPKGTWWCLCCSRHLIMMGTAQTAPCAFGSSDGMYVLVPAFNTIQPTLHVRPPGGQSLGPLLRQVPPSSPVSPRQGSSSGICSCADTHGGPASVVVCCSVGVRLLQGVVLGCRVSCCCSQSP